MESAIHPEFPKYTFFRDGTVLLQNGEITQGTESNGYYRIRIVDKNGDYQYKRVHRLLLEAFTGQSGDGLEVDHINENGFDNRLENLRFLTPTVHRRHTRRCNPHSSAACADKRGKIVIGTNEAGESIEFSTIIKAARHICNEHPNSGVISKAAKEGGTVNGWRFEYADMDAVGEVWRKVTNFPDLIQDVWVSNFGRLKTNRVVTFGIMSDGGYFMTQLSFKSKRIFKKIHTLVCHTFHGPAPPGVNISVNHKDRNIQNNRPENLEWSNPIAQANHKNYTPGPAFIGPLPIQLKRKRLVQDDAAPELL